MEWNILDRGHVLLSPIQRVHNRYTPGCCVDKTYLAAERNQLKHSICQLESTWQTSKANNQKGLADSDNLNKN